MEMNRKVCHEHSQDSDRPPNIGIYLHSSVLARHLPRNRTRCCGNNRGTLRNCERTTKR
jgi:hypothetical protein